MTRRNKQQVNRNRRVIKNRRSNGRRNRDRAVLPPAKTLMGHIMRTVVQTAWDIAQGALSLPEHLQHIDDQSHLTMDQPIFKPQANGTNWKQWNIDNGWLLAQGWIERFKGLFKEVKVHRITAHYLPYEPIDAVGEYVFALWDKDQDVGPNNFSEAVGTPASVVRKNGQPARLVWYPTEPEDRNWHDLSDQHIYCSSCLYQAETSYNVDPDTTPGAAVTPKSRLVGVEGKVIIDVDASFRGKPSQPNVSPSLASRNSKSLCTCRKCLRKILGSLMTSSSGSTTPFSMSV